MIRRTEIRITKMTTVRVPVGTRPVASLHKRSMAKSVVETTVTYTTSSMVEMHAVRSKAGAKIGSVMSKNSAERGTMITMAPTITSLTDSFLLKEGTFQEV
jgi:hypothetical protein